MIVQFYFGELEDSVLETIEMDIVDVQPFIDLVKEHGYEDADGNILKFDHARVEYPKKVVIYLEQDKE